VSQRSPERPGSALAARLKAELDERARQSTHSERLSRQHARTARARRDALMVDLATFARGVGHFRVWSLWGTLRVRFRGRTLRFRPRNDLVEVHSDTLSGRCRFEPQLSRWIFEPERGPGVILFDRGLSLLVAQALGVPAPPEED
jgi:hypothetical protein